MIRHIAAVTLEGGRDRDVVGKDKEEGEGDKTEEEEKGAGKYLADNTSF